MMSPCVPPTPCTGQNELDLAATRERERVLPNAGKAVRHGETQIAIFHFEKRGEYYATQTICPHRRDNVLARGLPHVGFALGLNDRFHRFALEQASVRVRLGHPSSVFGGS